jgi:protein O-GlcNAc transferase
MRQSGSVTPGTAGRRSFQEALLSVTQDHMGGKLDKARSGYEGMLATWPGHPDIVELLALLELQAGFPAKALTLIEPLAMAEGEGPNGRRANCLDILGQAQRALRRHDEALRSFRAGLALNPRHVGLHNNLGILLQELGHGDEAISCFEAAAALAPGRVEVHINLGNALRRARRMRRAISSYRDALALSPRSPYALNNLGVALRDQGDLEGAIECFRRAFLPASAFSDLIENLYGSLGAACDWDNLETFGASLSRLTAEELGCGRVPREPPAVAVMRSSDRAEILNVARAWSAAAASQATAGPLWRGWSMTGKLRIGYLFDGGRHSSVRRRLRWLAFHDRSRFEVVAYRHGGGPAGRDAAAAAGCPIVDLPQAGAAAAERIAADRIDILVDLVGHLEGGRIDICAYRPAPVQIAFPGFPATTGAEFFDYVITNPILTPDADRDFLTECPICLPMPLHLPDPAAGSDRADPSAAGRGHGFGDRTILFGSFNHPTQIDRRIFETWLGLLRCIPGSRLVLSKLNALARRNLAAAARNAGIDPGRLIFEGRCPSAAWRRAGRRAPDILLDARVNPSPWWVAESLADGIPVVALKGDRFASRCTESVLASFGVPELVAPDLDAYREIAAGLALDPVRRGKLTEKLCAAWRDGSVPGPAAFVRGLEWAFLRILETHRQGGAPRPLDVPARVLSGW